MANVPPAIHRARTSSTGRLKALPPEEVECILRVDLALDETAHHPLVTLEETRLGEHVPVGLLVERVQDGEDVVGPLERLEERQDRRPVAVLHEGGDHRFDRRLAEEDPKIIQVHRARVEPRGDLAARDQVVLGLGDAPALGLRREDHLDVLDVPTAEVRPDDRAPGERGRLERVSVPSHERAVDRELDGRRTGVRSSDAATSLAYGVVSRTFANSFGSLVARSCGYVSLGRNSGNCGFSRPSALAYGEAAMMRA